jgi:hypothetical protein
LFQLIARRKDAIQDVNANQIDDALEADIPVQSSMIGSGHKISKMEAKIKIVEIINYR